MDPARTPCAALLLFLGCSAPDVGPGLSVRLAAAPRPPGGCLGEAGAGLPASALIGQGGTLRLSVVRRDPGAAPRFVCDSVARVPDQTASLDLGADDGVFDVHGEWFDPTGARAGQGLVPGLSSSDKGGGALSLLLHRAGEWSCPQGALATGRAFHSATVLASGEVLLIGGAAALPEQGPSIFQLVNSVEVYDPRGGRFAPVAEEAGVVPRTRAFHHAAVLDEKDGVARILVYGGLTAPLRRGALDGAPGGPTQLRFTPIGTTQAAGAEVLTYDGRARSLVRKALPEAEFPRVAFAGGAALPGGGLLVAGGALFPAGREVEGQKSRLDAVTGLLAARPSGSDGAPVPGRTALDPWLVAPSVLPLSPATAILLGTARSLPDEAPRVRLRALRVAGLDGAPRIDEDGEIPGPATVYAAAVRLRDLGGLPQILVSGGFVMEPSNPIQARQPPSAQDAVGLYQIGPAAIERTAIVPYGPQAACGSAMEHFRPAGFLAATATGSGSRALLSGGTPTALSAGCQDCEAGDTGTIKLLCVLRQTALYRQASGKLEAGPPLGIGRMGHAQTLLLGGNVLVTGGLTRPGGDATPATTEAEVYVPRPRRGADDPDDPMAELLEAEGLSRAGLEAARPCRSL